ncbi:MAG: hypothetical protein IT239_03760 [Bacteroidia bacterium]|nr:hypothetical protein [Bacteroidia bacterium]
MLRRILFTFFVIITVAAGVVGYLYYQRLKVPTAAAISAIPNDAIALIQIRKVNTVWKKIKNENPVWKDLISTSYFASLNNYLLWIENVVNENGRLEDALENSNVLISYHAPDSVNKDFLFAISVPADVDDKYLDEVIKTSVSPDVYFSQHTLGNTIVYEAKSRTKPEVFSYCIKKGVFIAAFNSVVLESAINQLNNGENLTNNASFDKVYKTLNTQSDINIVINHTLFFKQWQPYTADSSLTKLATLQKIGEWSALDVKPNNEVITLSGLSDVAENNQSFLNVLNNQTSSKQTIEKIFPYNTVAYVAYNLSDFNSFYTGYQKFYNLPKSDDNSLLKTLGNEFALLYTDDAENNCNENAYLISKPTTITLSTTLLNQLSDKAKKIEVETENKNEEIIEGDKKDKKQEKENKKELDKAIKKENNNETNETTADTSTAPKPEVFEIRKLKTTANWAKLLGSAYGIINQNYFAVIKGYVVFGNTYNAIDKIIQNYQSGKTLTENESYKSFSQNLSNTASLFVYYNPARNTDFAFLLFNESTKKILQPYQETLRKFEGFAIQFSYNKGLYYTNSCLKHNPVYKAETVNSLWEIALDAPASIKPKIVINHTNQNKEIIVQDQNKQLYLINNKGEILWKKILEEPILSEITQIDRYKNNKFQYVFNTRNYIYMIDRNGSACEGFPIKLKYPSTNALSIFDYENNRDYRLVIACTNNRVYNYDAKGENVMGWEFTIMKYPILHPVQHFIINGKDYIIAIDQSGEIRLVDRKGKSILDFNQHVPIARNSEFFIEKSKDLTSSFIISTDSLGRVMKFKFNDRMDIIELKPASKSHYFDYKDVNDDGKRDYIIADGADLNVYNQDQTLLFNFKTKSTISNNPLFFLFPNGKIEIGLVSKPSNTIYLVNNQGKAAQGFPKPGVTAFSIGDMNRDKKFNIVVGSNDKKIFTYPIEE